MMDPTLLVLGGVILGVGLIVLIAMQIGGEALDAGTDDQVAVRHETPDQSAGAATRPEQRRDHPHPPFGVPTDAALGFVENVQTGDAFTVQLGDDLLTVRLAGLAAPRAGDPPTGDCFGNEAKSELASLLRPGMPIWISPDPGPLAVGGVLVGYAWRYELVPPRITLVNELMVARGYAVHTPPAPDGGYEEPERLREAELAARGANRGLWSACAAGPRTAL